MNIYVMLKRRQKLTKRAVVDEEQSKPWKGLLSGSVKKQSEPSFNLVEFCFDP